MFKVISESRADPLFHSRSGIPGWQKGGWDCTGGLAESPRTFPPRISLVRESPTIRTSDLSTGPRASKTWLKNWIIRFFIAQLLREKNPVHKLADAGEFQFLCLGGDGAVGDGVLFYFSLKGFQMRFRLSSQ